MNGACNSSTRIPVSGRLLTIRNARETGWTSMFPAMHVGSIWRWLAILLDEGNKLMKWSAFWRYVEHGYVGGVFACRRKHNCSLAHRAIKITISCLQTCTARRYCSVCLAITLPLYLRQVPIRLLVASLFASHNLPPLYVQPQP